MRYPLSFPLTVCSPLRQSSDARVGDPAGGVAGLKPNVAVARRNWLASVDEPPEAALAVFRDAVVHDDPLI